MKIYIVHKQWPYDETEIIGVFDTPEKARLCIEATLNESKKYMYIQEYEVQ